MYSLKTLLTLAVICTAFGVHGQITLRPVNRQITEIIEFDDRFLRVYSELDGGNFASGIATEDGRLLSFENGESFANHYGNYILTYKIYNDEGFTSLTLYRQSKNFLEKIASTTIRDYVDQLEMSADRIVGTNIWEGSGNSIYLLDYSLSTLGKVSVDEYGKFFSKVAYRITGASLNAISQYEDDIMEIIQVDLGNLSVLERFSFYQKGNFGSLELSNDAVYLKSLNQVICIDLTGAKRWEKSFDAPIQSWVISPDLNKLVLFQKDKLALFDASLGQLIWEKDYTEVFQGDREKIRASQVDFKSDGEVLVTLGKLTRSESSQFNKSYVLKDAVILSSNTKGEIWPIKEEIHLIGRNPRVDQKHLLLKDKALLK